MTVSATLAETEKNRGLDGAVERFGLCATVPAHPANDRHGRIEEVLDRRALAQEFGIETERQAIAELAPGGRFQRGGDAFFGDAGKHGAANHDGMGIRLGGDGLADRGNDRIQGVEGLLATGRAGCSYRNQGDFGRLDSRHGVRRGRNIAFFAGFRRALGDPFFDYRRGAGINGVDFCRACIDTDYPVSHAGEARAGDGTHVAHAEDGYFHTNLILEALD